VDPVTRFSGGDKSGRSATCFAGSFFSVRYPISAGTMITAEKGMASAGEGENGVDGGTQPWSDRKWRLQVAVGGFNPWGKSSGEIQNEE